jgi:hypothetical protein
MSEEGTILERLERIERHLQEQQAEIFAFRLILMVLVTRLLGAPPDFAEESLGGHHLHSASSPAQTTRSAQRTRF